MNARVATALACWIAIAGHTAHAQPPLATAPADYAQAMQQELDAMGANARCAREENGRQHCVWPTRARLGAADVALHAVYSTETDSIYFYIERFLVLAPEGAKTAATLRRLMELNWELLIGKFEWNPHTGEVRASAVLSTDSNFDRRAFRSIVRALDAIALRYYAELHEERALPPR